VAARKAVVPVVVVVHGKRVGVQARHTASAIDRLARTDVVVVVVVGQEGDGVVDAVGGGEAQFAEGGFQCGGSSRAATQ